MALSALIGYVFTFVDEAKQAGRPRVYIGQVIYSEAVVAEREGRNLLLTMGEQGIMEPDCYSVEVVGLTDAPPA